MSDDIKKRTQRLNVRLNSDLVSRLDEIAEQMGLPASTLGALAIGEYVMKHRKNDELALLTARMTSERSSEAMVDVIKPMAEKLFLDASQGKLEGF